MIYCVVKCLFGVVPTAGGAATLSRHLACQSHTPPHHTTPPGLSTRKPCSSSNNTPLAMSSEKPNPQGVGERCGCMQYDLIEQREEIE